MRSQIEKNKEILLEEIEKLIEKPIDNAVADRLNTYRGAYKALCLLSDGAYRETKGAAQSGEKQARTVEMDGDTEFERLIISMPFDMAHAKSVASIFADHMESLCVMNKRAYDNVMARLREVAER